MDTIEIRSDLEAEIRSLVDKATKHDAKGQEYEHAAREHFEVARKYREVAETLASKFQIPMPEVADGDHNSPTIAFEPNGAPGGSRVTYRSGQLTEDPKTRAEWIATVLDKLGRPARIPEILDGMKALGQQNIAKRNVFFNACYTAMRRRPDLFKEVNSGLWDLTERT